jgi:acyl-coenzyme A thioesterase PaaI-like protein
VELEAVLARIPYLEAHALEVEEGAKGAVRVKMPLRAGLTNHVGIFHAGALFTAAETAAGVSAYRVVPDDRAFVLLRGAAIRYTRRAEGEVIANARIEGDAALAARDAFDASGRGDVVIDVTAHDAGGEVVFEGSFDYALRPRNP